jgi:hypothetical protein
LPESEISLPRNTPLPRLFLLLTLPQMTQLKKRDLLTLR